LVLGLLQEILASPELISSLTALAEARSALGADGDVARSPLQIELILLSLNQSSGKPQVRVLL